jgi:tripartite-type tricarboxylate transporter receptor subunit TctC
MKTIPKPRAIALAALAPLLSLALASLAQNAHAEWPDHPIHLVVPFGPGGANDLIGRVAADGLAKQLHQPVIIDNKPGAGAVIGADYVAKSKPDGYTFLVGAAGTVTNSLVRKSMPYADSDLTPVGMIAVAPSVIIVHPSVPANNLKEFIAYAKAQGGPGGLNFSTAGTASTPHFVAEMLKETAGLEFTIIPFKSGQEGVNAVIGNSVPVTSEASIVVIPQIKGGKVKAIADTYTRRISALPDLKTAAEQGYPGINIGHWAGLYAPSGTPPAIIQKMNAALQAALKEKETIDRLVPAGIEPQGGSIADFVKFIEAERARLGAVAKKAGMKED